MNTSATNTAPAQACGLYVGQHEFAVLLRDGRRLVVPFGCFPRLEQATPEQRRHFELYSDGKMLHWPDLDEDIEVQHLVEGRLPVKAADPLTVG
jgi:hypothetical protein